MTRCNVLDIDGNDMTKWTLIDRCKMCLVITSLALHFVIDRPMARVFLLLRCVQGLLQRMNYVMKSFKLNIAGEVKQQQEGGGQWPA